MVTNAAALAKWVKAQGATLDAFGADVALLAALAAAVDADVAERCHECGRSSATAALWREYRVAFDGLRDRLLLEGTGDGEIALVRAMSAALGDTEKAGTKKSRAS